MPERSPVTRLLRFPSRLLPAYSEEQALRSCVAHRRAALRADYRKDKYGLPNHGHSRTSVLRTVSTARWAINQRIGTSSGRIGSAPQPRRGAAQSGGVSPRFHQSAGSILSFFFFFGFSCRSAVPPSSFLSMNGLVPPLPLPPRRSSSSSPSSSSSSASLSVPRTTLARLTAKIGLIDFSRV